MFIINEPPLSGFSCLVFTLHQYSDEPTLLINHVPLIHLFMYDDGRDRVGRAGGKHWEQTHLVTDQLPLLLVVVLTEDLHFVGRKIHRVLKTERENKEELRYGLIISQELLQEDNGGNVKSEFGIYYGVPVTPSPTWQRETTAPPEKSLFIPVRSSNITLLKDNWSSNRGKNGKKWYKQTKSTGEQQKDERKKSLIQVLEEMRDLIRK